MVWADPAAAAVFAVGANDRQSSTHLLESCCSSGMIEILFSDSSTHLCGCDPGAPDSFKRHKIDLTRCLGHMSRQGEMKGGSSSIISGRPQAAAVRLHNGTADGQPHAAALRLGGKKCRKDLIHLLHWQPHARVTDRELELTVLQFRLHRKLSA